MTLPSPIALCLEDLRATTDARRYLQCVAVAGGTPGLTVDQNGRARWRRPRDVAYELWVSADDQLILLRPAGGPAVTVERAGRRLEVPAEHPVVLLDQDQLRCADRHLLVHVHGPAHAVAPPTWLDLSEPAPATLTKAAAAAMVVGAAVAGGACKETPAADTTATSTAVASATEATSETTSAEPDTATAEVTEVTGAASASATASASAAPTAKPAPIEVRRRPPKPVMRKDDKDRGF